jgi:cobalamin biosynthesis protein CobC
MKHGGDLSKAIARYGGPLESWLDLSTGINPHPWPVSAGLLAAGVNRLPSRADDDALIAAARDAYAVPSGAEVAIAPGTQALIQWLPRLAASGAVAIVAPTYSEHAIAWSHGDREVVTCGTIQQFAPQVRHAVIVNPNNPDGRRIPIEAIEAAARTLRDRRGWLVIDEAFVDVEPERSATQLCASLPIVVLRSFGKFYGLPGLRLGFAIADAGIIKQLRDALGPWAVSGPALAIGAAALRDRTWAANTRERLKQDTARLVALLEQASCKIVGGTALFTLVRHADAQALHERLARQHIWCRTFDWAPDLLRFGLPADEGFDRIANALR